MSFATFSTLVLGGACGFGAMIYVLVATWHWQHNSKRVSFWYYILAAAYILASVITVGRFVGFFGDLPRGTTLIILAPILGIPPGIQWFAWLKARRLIRETRGG